MPVPATLFSTSMILLILDSTLKALYDRLGRSKDWRNTFQLVNESSIFGVSSPLSARRGDGGEASFSQISLCTSAVAEAVNARTGIPGNSSLRLAMRKYGGRKS